MKILLVEDNELIIKGLDYALKINNYNLTATSTIKETIKYLKENTPDLIILDITLPDGSGLVLYEENIKSLKIPTIFLTAEDDEEIIVKGLKIAEDYITKPFSTKELLARINKIILRTKKNTIIKVKDISFDLDKMLVYKDDEKVDLTSLELNILKLLFENINKVIRRGTILDKIWELTGNDVDDHTVTVYLKRIREKLNSDIIITIKGIGYRIDQYEK